MSDGKTGGSPSSEELESVLPPKKKLTDAKAASVARRARIARQDYAEVTQMTTDRALKLLGRNRREQAEKNRQRSAEREGVEYYVECGHCGGPAFFMTRFPRGPLKADEWYASYKPLDIPFSGNAPYCQCCEREGRGQVPVPILHYGESEHSVRGRFKPLPRMIIEYDISELELEEVAQ